MRKHGSIILAVLLIIGTLAGCGSNANNTESAGSTGSNNVETERQTGDTITFVQNADVTSLDPGVGKEQTAFTVHCNMYDQLVKKDSNGEILPMLAESWEQVSDSEIKFYLREDVYFHNGEQMNADDVKFSFERAINSSYVGQMVSYLKEVDVVDEFTVIVRAKTPYAPLLGSLTQGTCSIVPKDYVEKIGDKAFAEKPIGSGPYKLLEKEPGEYIKLEAFDKYYGGTPKTKYLVMKIVPEAAQRAIMLETGEITAAYGLLASDIVRLQEDSKVKVASAPSAKAILIYLNHVNGYLEDPKVRQAVECAIDKDVIVENVLLGLGEPTATVISSSLVGYNPNLVKNKYNVEKAKQLLTEAGYSNGGIEMTFWTNADQTYVEVATAIQNMLSEVGVKLNIETMETGTLLSKLRDKEGWNMGMHFTNCLTGEADVTIYNTMSPNASSNYSGYSNQTMMDLLTEARGTLDLSKRQVTYNQIYQIIEEDVPNIAVYTEVVAVGLGEGVEGFELNRTGAHRYENVTVYK